MPWIPVTLRSSQFRIDYSEKLNKYTQSERGGADAEEGRVTGGENTRTCTAVHK